MTKWFIDQKADDFVEGKQVDRISIGGTEDTGYYIVFRGRAKQIAKLLRQASKNMDDFLKQMGVEE